MTDHHCDESTCVACRMRRVLLTARLAHADFNQTQARLLLMSEWIGTTESSLNAFAELNERVNKAIRSCAAAMNAAMDQYEAGRA